MSLKLKIASEYVPFLVGHKDVRNSAARIASHSHMYITAHLKMHMVYGYSHAKCQVPVPMHKEEADEILGGCDFSLRNSDFSKVVKMLMKP